MTHTAQLSPRILWFLTHLEANNSKVWMDERRDFYQDSKQEFIDFGQALLLELVKVNPNFADVDIKKCLFRINRDMRFSRDKTPYKPWFGFYIAPGGKKSSYAWLYLHIQPWGRSLVAGWCYELDRENLQAVREQLIIYDQELSLITNDKAFRSQFWQIHGKPRIPYLVDISKTDHDLSGWCKIHGILTNHTLMSKSRTLNFSHKLCQTISSSSHLMIISMKL